MFDLYESDDDYSARYVLGKSGTRKLFVIGLNPSTATREKSDTTVSKVRKVAEDKCGYNGFVMFNLYPLRSTIVKKLPHKKREELINKNVEYIIKIARMEKEPHFWAAWGQNIYLRVYFLESLHRIFDASKRLSVKWLHFGKLTKTGHPRHPSRLSYEWHFQEFKIRDYLERQRFVPNS